MNGMKGTQKPNLIGGTQINSTTFNRSCFFLYKIWLAAGADSYIQCSSLLCNVTMDITQRQLKDFIISNRNLIMVVYWMNPFFFYLGRSEEQASSLSQDFHVRLDSLMKTLQQTTPHFVRCIRVSISPKSNRKVQKQCSKEFLCRPYGS